MERVGQGTVLVDEAGSTMDEVVAAIKRVTDLMGEIDSASNEQAAGVAQVGEAVTQMDHATQQNAALVEQIAAAASGLRAQAGDLVQTVAVFKLDGQGATSPAPAQALHAHPQPNPGKPHSSPRAALPKPRLHAVPVAHAAPAAGNDEWETF